MTRKQNSARKARWKEELKQILAEERDLLKSLIQEAVQQVLEAEMDEAIGWDIGPATTAERWSHGWARSSCECRRIAKGTFVRKSSSAISERRKHWSQR